MKTEEAREIVESMITRRIDGADLDREAARRMREYAFGQPTAAKRAHANEMADVFDNRAHQKIRAAEALRIVMEEDNGWRRDRTEGEAATADDALGTH